MSKIPIRPSVIIIKDGKVLCIRMKSGFYLFPGGGILPGEKIEECAIRETFEETNLKVRLKKVIYINDYIKSNNGRCLNLIFLGEIIGRRKAKINLTDKGKNLTVEWIPLKDFHKVDFRPSYIAKRLYKDFKEGFLDSPIFFASN